MQNQHLLDEYIEKYNIYIADIKKTIEDNKKILSIYQHDAKYENLIMLIRNTTQLLEDRYKSDGDIHKQIMCNPDTKYHRSLIMRVINTINNV